MMLNAFELIRSIPIAKTFQIGELLFAQFACPVSENPIGIWTETDHLLHVVSGTSSWKTACATHSAKTGDSVFFKKGAYILPPHMEENVCVELFFIPDAYVRETVLELAPDLPVLSPPVESSEPAIRVNNDVGLFAFFQAMTVYFASQEKPPEALLKLKLKELLVSILVGENNRGLSSYLRSIADSGAPSIRAIMEANFCHNLSIDEFARLCHRSISSFKRDFRKNFGTSPGKLLLERRLRQSALFLQTTKMNVTEIAFECGFEDLSHFSRTFKEKFGHPPALYRELLFNQASSQNQTAQYR